MSQYNTKDMKNIEKNPYTKSLGQVMSNYDHEIDRKVAKQLTKEEAFADYPAWNFMGYVWYDRKEKQYYCEVWQYHEHVDTVCGSLEGIMEELSNEYGAD